ncbi:hypothetical protein TRICI_001047 [Trichomonascus ciferrii]|uniref:Coronin n=1 Tax=Trichomonascus ciferrii TaxID=44093 RepID=A0A642VAF9_9ASCO|nr:hypothetical protein TRICI_001047 [Trichomonascus ciferrii]
MIKANPKYISVNWDASGGGAFGVIPLNEYGKMHETIPLCRGHTGAVLDTDWSPFDDQMVASASDDGTVGIFKIPEDFTLKVEPAEGEKEPEIKDVLPIKKLKGHAKKVGHVLFHPTAKNVLASASGDCTVKIWNIDTEEVLFTLQHKDFITGLSFNETGSMLATTSRDKRLRIWDVRAEKIIGERQAHSGAKSQRVVWLGNADRVVTTGFDKSDRQFALWDIYNLDEGPIGGYNYIGPSSGICMPFYDEGTHIIYLAGKGDGNIVYYEYADDKVHPLSEYQSGEPQRGMAVLPRRGLNVQHHEIFRFFKTINDTSIEPVSFIIPRKSETFQEDVYPAARAGEPALTADEWASGKDSAPKMISLAAVFDGKEASSFDAPPNRETGSEKKEEPKKEKPKTEEAAKKSEVSGGTPPDPQGPLRGDLGKEKEAATPDASVSSPGGDKKNIDKVLQGSKDVDSLLNKAINDDEPEIKTKQVDDSGWNSEDDEPEIKQIKETSIESSAKKIPENATDPVPVAAEQPEQKEEAKAESSKKEPESSKKEPESSKKEPEPEKKVSEPEAKSEPVSDKKEPEPQHAAPETTHHHHGPMEKLTKQVESLSANIESLSQQLKSRDDKIDRLEQMIEQLLAKA